MLREVISKGLKNGGSSWDIKNLFEMKEISNIANILKDFIEKNRTRITSHFNYFQSIYSRRII